MAEEFKCPWCRSDLIIREVSECTMDCGQIKLVSYVTKEGECDTCGAKWIIDLQYREVV